MYGILAYHVSCWKLVVHIFQDHFGKNRAQKQISFRCLSYLMVSYLISKEESNKKFVLRRKVIQRSDQKVSIIQLP